MTLSTWNSNKTIFGLFMLLSWAVISPSSWMVQSFQPTVPISSHHHSLSATTTRVFLLTSKNKNKNKKEEQVTAPNVEETTQKYGLEMGLAQAAKQGDGESAKTLLKKYGIAYLATSIPLALASFILCYILVDNGVNVSALLSQIGIQAQENDAADKAGTFAIAYAAHKAASPIRFPPTVLLTPIVAKFIGKEPDTSSSEEDEAP